MPFPAAYVEWLNDVLGQACCYLWMGIDSNSSFPNCFYALFFYGNSPQSRDLHNLDQQSVKEATTIHNGPTEAPLVTLRNPISQWLLCNTIFCCLRTECNYKNPHRFTTTANFLQLWRSWEWFGISIFIDSILQCCDEYRNCSSRTGQLSDSMGCVDVYTRYYGTGMCY